MPSANINAALQLSPFCIAPFEIAAKMQFSGGLKSDLSDHYQWVDVGVEGKGLH
jgi:hypothetical protein